MILLEKCDDMRAPWLNHRRQLLGQNLSGLRLEDLKGLENQLETSLHNIRLAKVISSVNSHEQGSCIRSADTTYYSSQDQLMIDELEELNKKVSA